MKGKETDISWPRRLIRNQERSVSKREEQAGKRIEEIVNEFSEQFTQLGVIEICNPDIAEYLLYDVKNKRLFRRGIDLMSGNMGEGNCYWGDWLKYGKQVLIGIEKANLKTEQNRQ